MFDNITQDMISQLDGNNKAQYYKLKEISESSQMISSEFIYTISELANSLAVKSYNTGTEYKIALPLIEAFDQILQSQQTSHFFTVNYQQEISDTRLDLNFASGDHAFGSQRLATFLMATQYYLDNVQQTTLAPGIKRFA